jgi:integrase
VPLSETKARNAKPKSKPYKLTDGDGLFLLVTPAGGKYWRLKYYLAGKEKLLALGVYPEVGLADARERRAQARKHLAAGIDPSEEKKEVKRQANLRSLSSFDVVAYEWLANREHVWSERHYRTTRWQIEKHVLPRLGNRPIAEITALEVLEMLREIEAKGTLDTAHKMKQVTGTIFMYAVATGRAERNPVTDLRGALKTPVVRHRAYLREAELPDYLEKLESYAGSMQTKLALQFLLLTFVRTTELRAAQWKEFDWDKAEWRIPAERMKMGDEHVVPLSRQAIGVLRELEKQSGNRLYVFPNEHNPSTYMSENTMLYALYRMGYHSRATGHGFRSTASTILNEHGFRPDVIERQLAHSERNSVRAAYNHAQYLPERREMMQWWADHLDLLARRKQPV